MFKDLDYNKRYASHYIQLGSSYIRNAMLFFDDEHHILLAPFDKEYPQTIFFSGTIIIHKIGEEASLGISKDLEISLVEMQGELNKAPDLWCVKLP